MRHPGDVAISYFEYLGAKGRHSMRKTDLKAFIRDSEYGVPAWCEHVESWRPEADVVLRYEDLKEDVVSSVQRALKALDIDYVQNSVVKQAVVRSSFNNLRNIEEKEERVLPKEFDSSYKFTRKGKVGEWKDRLDRKDIDYIRSEIGDINVEIEYSNNE
jgi:hypothetical protein